MLRLAALAAALLLALTGLAACGSGSTASNATLHVTLKGGKITDPAQAITVGVGKTLTIQIDADQAGSLHVHSSPEQHLEFGVGQTTKKLVFNVPGVVEIEDHQTEQLVAQVKVQ